MFMYVYVRLYICMYVYTIRKFKSSAIMFHLLQLYKLKLNSKRKSKCYFLKSI